MVETPDPKWIITVTLRTGAAERYGCSKTFDVDGNLLTFTFPNGSEMGIPLDLLANVRCEPLPEIVEASKKKKKARN